MTYLIKSSQRRVLVFASTAFFLTSVWLCTSRLASLRYTPVGPPPDGYTADGKLIATPDDKGGLINHAGEVVVTPDGKVVGQGSSISAGGDPYAHIDIQLSKADLPMSYGAFGRPTYDDITLLETLPDELVPTIENKRRLIVLGDIHGNLDALDAVLYQVGFDDGKDHIISVGDMVNKGSDSAGVVQRLMSLKASAVRGNHEDRVLLALASANARKGVDAGLNSELAEEHRGESGDLKTARSLSTKQVNWLRQLPAILSVEALNIYIAHAGLVPGVSIEQQDPWAVMNMRTLRWPREEFRKKEEERKKKEEEKKRKKLEKERKEAQKKGSWKRDESEQDEESFKKAFVTETRDEDDDVHHSPDNDDDVLESPDHDIWTVSETPDGEPWTYLWNREERRNPASERRTVIYGHDAKRGYHEEDYSFGLDSGCGRGTALSAFVIQAGPTGGWVHTTSQVPCSKE